MNREDQFLNRNAIIRMARDAGCTANEANAWSVFLERFFQLATEWQQIKDAEICHNLLDPDCSDSYNRGIAAAGSAIIRGETK